MGSPNIHKEQPDAVRQTVPFKPFFDTRKVSPVIKRAKEEDLLRMRDVVNTYRLSRGMEPITLRSPVMDSMVEREYQNIMLEELNPLIKETPHDYKPPTELERLSFQEGYKEAKTKAKWVTGDPELAEDLASNPLNLPDINKQFNAEATPTVGTAALATVFPEFVIPGLVGGKAVDWTTQALSDYSSFGLAVENELGVPKGFGDFLNFGYYLGPGSFNAVKNGARNTYNAYNTYRLGSRLNNAVKTWEGSIPDKVLSIEYSKPTLYPKGKHIFNTRNSTLTEAERLGIPKGERNNMSLDQIDALSDLIQYVRSGRFRTKFAINPETADFGWFKDIPDGYVPILKFVADRNSGKIPLDNTNWLRIPLKSPETGLIGVLSYSLPDKFNTATFTARFPKPKEMRWSPGEANAMIDGPDKNRGYQVIFTSPRTDAQDMVDASQEFINSLPNTIDKDIIKNFWILQSKAAKPGSYLSGDNGEFPLGNTLIGTYKQNGLSSAILELRLVKRVPLIVRNGLSPDSYSSIIRQALRNGNELRWGKGFTKWNNSAIKNLRIYNAWKQWKNGEISFEDYEKVFNSWADEIGGRHLQFMTSNGKKIPVHPHPFIYYKKQGGKVLLKTK